MTPVALTILAHPDDAEILCGGTLLRLHREHGWEIHLATMTAGDCGSAEHSADEISRIRRAEAAAAAKLLGGTYHCIGAFDLKVFHDAHNQAAVTRLVRRVRPAVIITHSPDDYHLDHEAASTLARAAAFAAPCSLYLHGEPGPPATDHVPHVYYCDPVEGKDIFGREIVPTTLIDISTVIDAKSELLACHASQRHWLHKHHGVDDYIETMRHWSAARGKVMGVEFAEGFRQHLGHGYPQSDVLSQILR